MKMVLYPSSFSIFMQCLEEVKPIILFIVNDSLKTSMFPEALKSALVQPSIKDENGDSDSCRNYQPISNLPFLSKVINNEPVFTDCHNYNKNCVISITLYLIYNTLLYQN